MQNIKEQKKETGEYTQEIEKALELARKGKLTEKEVRKMLGLSVKQKNQNENIIKEEIQKQPKEKKRLFHKIKKAIQKKQSKRHQQKSNQRLIQVVREAIKKGYSKKQIEQGLKKKGWSSEEINKSLISVKR